MINNSAPGSHRSVSSTSSSPSSSTQPTPAGSPRNATQQPPAATSEPLAIPLRHLGAAQQRELTTVRALSRLASATEVWTVDQLKNALDELSGSAIVRSSTPPGHLNIRDDMDLIWDRYEAVALAIESMKQAGVLSRPSPELAHAIQGFELQLMRERAKASSRADHASGLTG